MKRYSRLLILIFVLVLTILLSGGTWFYYREQRRLQEHAQHELQSIVSLKIAQLTLWREERIEDAATLMENPFIINQIRGMIRKPYDSPADELLDYFRSLQVHYDYANILLIDGTGKVLLSIAGHSEVAHEDVKYVLPTVFEKRYPVLTDLHTGPNGLPPHVDAVAPIFEQEKSTPIGAIVLQHHAQRFLYPMLQSWPVPSQSAETLIVRREGNNVLFLNELRHRPNSAFTFRISLEQKDIPAVMAVLGYRGFFQGKDYRGIDVLSAIQPIPDTPWFMIAKVDTAEILARWHSESLLLLSIMILSVVATAMMVGLIWYRNAMCHYQILFQAESTLRASEEKYHHYVQESPLGIFVFDAETRCIDANPAASNITGFTCEDLCGMSWEHLLSDGGDSSALHYFDQVKEKGRSVNELQIRHKDGHIVNILMNMVQLSSHQYIGFCQDMTEKQQATRALQDARQVAQDIMEQMPAGLFVYRYEPDEHLILEDANPQAERLTGIHAVEWRGREFDEIWPKARGAGITQQFLAVMQTGNPLSLHDVDYADNRIRIVTQIHAFPLPDNRLAVTFEDVTERKLASDALAKSNMELRETLRQLEQSKNMLQLVIESIPVRVFWKDHNLQYLGCNTLFAHDAGFEYPQQLLNKDDYDMVWCEHAERYRTDDRQVIETCQPKLNIIEPLTNARGMTIWISTSKVPLQMDNGIPFGILGVYEDVSERKRYEDALRESEERYRAIVECQDDAVCRWLPDTTLTFVNACYRELFGRGKTDLIGQKWIDFIPDSEQESVLQTVQEVSGQLKKISYEHSVQLSDGSIRWYLWVDVPLLDEQGKCSEIQSVGRDITERKQAEDQLEAERTSLARRVEERTADLSRTNAELAQALRAKDSFLATMSHELRTPLNAILGLSESLLEGVHGSLNACQVKSMKTIELSGQHLLALISDILDLSKIEAGKLEIHPEIVSVAEVCQSSLGFFKEIAFKKQLHLLFYLDDQHIKLKADPKRLKQILVNLLSNAVKFTPSGGQVILQVKPVKEQEVIHFIVQDNGIGILAKDMDKLFHPFTQLDSSLSRQYEGTGLGLALVRRLVDLHGGSITLESEGVLSKGSRFTVSLPWQNDSPVKTTPISQFEEECSLFCNNGLPERLDHKQKTILFVEDNEVSIQTIGDYLVREDFHIVIARDGGEAIHQAQETLPDLILMDIQIPVLNGLQVTQRLRSDERFTHTPIIALTALAMPGDREYCLSAGVNDYIAKPVRLKELRQKIKALLEEQG